MSYELKIHFSIKPSTLFLTLFFVELWEAKEKHPTYSFPKKKKSNLNGSFCSVKLLIGIRKALPLALLSCQIAEVEVQPVVVFIEVDVRL